MLPPLTCTHCSEILLNNNYDSTLGLVKCNNCSIHAPIVNGIIYYTELDIAYHSDENDFIKSFSESINKRRAEYRKFMDNKISRNLIDAYSTFQPFNESSRSFYPFINDLKKKLLKPGDLILDTWCRTGWTGYFLASQFPEQSIVSIWEGNKDVLGYAGFDYWMGINKRPKNLTLMHLDLNKPIPFADNTFKLVYGLDTLHRYEQANLISELLRITDEEGALIFPHLHLTNSEPEPFFERGEKQIHGTEWERYFNKRLANTKWNVHILSEPSLFDLKQSKPLTSEPNTSDYNGLIAILPVDKIWNLTPLKADFNVVNRVIVNPYLKIDLNQATVNIDPEYLNGTVGKMLERHPVYYNRVRHLTNFELSSREVQLLYLAQHNYTIDEIAFRLEVSVSTLVPVLEKLIDSEIIHVLPLSEEAINLQLFHSAIPFAPEKVEQTIFHLLKEIGNTETGNPVIVDLAEDAELEVEDVKYLTDKIKARFIQQDIDHGDCIFICSKPHFETILVLWSAMELGIEVSVISTEIPHHIKIELFKEREAKGYFMDPQTYLQLVEQVPKGDIVVVDDENTEVPNELFFSNWLDLAPDRAEQTTFPGPDEIAVTLYSSGSTGKPKGIQLSHRTLYKSGKIFAETYHWTNEDKLMMVTELDSMSGLRNIAIASIFSGSTIVIPSFSGSNNILSIVEGIEHSQATILTCTPALIKQFLNLGDRIRTSLKSLKQVLCTGGNLSPTLVDQFKTMYNIRILNYYGLTETSGLCIGETPENASDSANGSIGMAIDSIAQLVDEDNKPVLQGNIGRLRIFNDRMMSGYLKISYSSDLIIEDGWLYTGDLAIQNEAGAFFLKGRERNIIKDMAGNIVYLTEVEDTLLSHYAIRDVEVMKYENDGIESLFASVWLNDPASASEQCAAEIKSFVRQKLGNSKVPVIAFVNQLERNSRGNLKGNKSEIEISK